MDEFELDNFDEEVNHAEQSFNNNAKPEIEANGDNEPNAARRALPDGAGQGSAKEDESRIQEIGLFPGIANFDYHRKPGISSTQLKHELTAPQKFRAYQTGEIVFEPTRQMRLGTAVHSLALEPFEFDNQIALLPKNCQGNAKNAAVNKQEFLAENHGKDYIHIQDIDVVHFMRDALMKHPEAGELLQDSAGQAELSGFYKDYDEETGVGTHMFCRYRPDLRLDWCIGDIKTTQDASLEAFTYTIGKFGYDVSAAHYLEGDRLLTATDHNRFFFICVESKPPYLCSVYWLDEPGLKVGHWRRRLALHSIQQCRRLKQWPSYNANQVTSISVPNSLKYLMEHEN